MWAIAKSTFREVYRKRIVHLVGILTLLYWGILGLIFHYQAAEFGAMDSQLSALINLSGMVMILGFYLSSMLLALLTVMLSVGIISSEVEDGTVLTLLTKPIHRSDYVLGKYLGVSLMIAVYAAILYLAIFIFAAVGGQNLPKVFGLLPVIQGFLLFLLQPLTIAAVAVYGSTVFKTVNNGIFVIALYLLSTIGGILEQIGTFANLPDLSTFGILASLLAPFEVIYRKLVGVVFKDIGGFATIMGGPVGSSGGVEPSAYMMLYIALYLFGALLLAVRNINRKDIS